MIILRDYLAWKFLIFIYLISLPYISFSQEKPENEKKSDYELAVDLYKQKKYQKALPLFAQLLINYPKDPTYSYHYGVCLLKLGKIEKAINILRYASTQEVTEEVYYHLGNAYHLNYQFLKAIQFYKRYQLNADVDDVKLIEIDRLVNMCYNGIYLMNYFPSIEVKNKKTTHQLNFYKQYNMSGTGGKLMEKPSKLKTVTEIELNEQNMMFVPNEIEQNEILYFSGYNDNGKNGKDIFYTKKIGDGKWSKPMNLGNIINSPYNEDYPYIHSDGVTLYFCSEGHYSMGGYDIYKSVFSEETQTWSPPENLDFPINSPYDDILFIPDIYATSATFSSKRDADPGKINIYTIKISATTEQNEITDIDKIKKISRLEPVEKDEAPITQKPVDSTKQDSQDKLETEMQAVEQQYQLLLQDALTLQSLTDSLLLLKKELHKQILNAKSDDEKNVIRKKLGVINVNLDKNKDLKDGLFAKIKEIENTYFKKYIRFYVDEDKIIKVKTTDFLSIDEVKNLLGPKNIQRIILINEAILDNKLIAQETDVLKKQIKELKRALKSTKDKKANKKNQKKISKLEKEMFDKLLSAYEDNHQKSLEKYNLYKQYIPEAIKHQDNEIYIELANDNIETAGRYHKKTNEIYRTIDNYDNKNYKVKKLKMADSLDFKSLISLETAILALFNYEVDDGKSDRMLEEIAQFSDDESIDSLLNEFKNISTMDSLVTKNKIEVDDTLVIVSKQVDNVELENTNNLVEQETKMSQRGNANKQFELLESSPYSENNPIPTNFKLPDGIIYRIQLGVFSKNAEFERFKGLFPITCEITKSGYYKYFAGLLKRYKSAENAIKIVREEGFKDAFIVAYEDGNKISTEKAKAIEPKGAQIITPEVKNEIKEEKTTPEITIKIQIGAFQGQMPIDILNNFKHLAPEKLLEEYLNENGIRVYTIGNFYNFEEANKFKKYLIDKGHNGIFLIAFKDGKKIPVGEALKQLND